MKNARLAGAAALVFLITACGDDAQDSEPAAYGGGVTGDDSVSNADAFYEAVERLEAAPLLDLTFSEPGLESALRITRDGLVTGSLQLWWGDVDLLVLDGTIYLRAPDGFIPGVTTDLSADDLAAQWVVTDGDELEFLVTEDVMTPAAFAVLLRDELDRTDDFHHPDGAAQDLDGTGVMAVHTPEMAIYVSEDEPHEIVRVTPHLGLGLGVGPDDINGPGSDEHPDNLGLNPSAGFDPSEIPGLEDLFRVDVQVQPSDDPDAFSDLIGLYEAVLDDIDELHDAIDATIFFDLDAQPDIACGATCTVTAAVVTTVTSGFGEAADADINAQMNARISADGTFVGSCRATGELPANGTTTLSCSSTEAATQVNRMLDQRARSAPAGTVVTLYYSATVDFTAFAVSSEDVEDLAIELQENMEAVIDDLCDLAMGLSERDDVDDDLYRDYCPPEDEQ